MEKSEPVSNVICPGKKECLGIVTAQVGDLPVASLVWAKHQSILNRPEMEALRDALTRALEGRDRPDSDEEIRAHSLKSLQCWQSEMPSPDRMPDPRLGDVEAMLQAAVKLQNRLRRDGR